MRAIPCLVFFLLPLTTLWAQKHTEPEYYTDSDLKKRIVLLEARSSSMVGMRRLATTMDGTVVDPSLFPYKPRFVMSNGIHGAFLLKGSLHAGIGVEMSDWSYAVHSPSLPVEPFTWRGSYWAIPFRAGFVTEVNETYTLEVWPQATVNRLNVFRINDEDQTVQATQQFWSGGISLFGGRAVGVRGRFLLGATMDFGFRPLYYVNARATEYPIRTGVSAGYRMAF